jgi:hypothetical protein
MSGIGAWAFAIMLQPQQEAALVTPDRCIWIGGQGTEP